MPERCPICDTLECTHSETEKEVVRLQNKVKMLESAIEGWRKENTRLEALVDLFSPSQKEVQYCSDCNCGKAEGCR